MSLASGTEHSSSGGSGLSPQQAALRTLRARYERGELTFETFRAAFNALLEASSPAECQGILDGLPVLPQTVLDALDRSVIQASPRAHGTRWIINVLGEVSRTKRPWRLGHRTNGIMLIGEATLDLSLAELPTRGSLTFFGAIGELTIRVPRSLALEVCAFTMIGEATVLGEEHGGIFALGHEDAVGQGDGPQLRINVFMLIGEVNVTYVDVPTAAKRLASGTERKELSQ